VKVANDFDAKLVINTSEATRGISALDKESKALTETLRALDSATKDVDKGLASVARSVTSIVAAQRQASKATNDDANASLRNARTKAQEATARDRNASAALREAKAQATTAAQAARQSNAFQDLSSSASTYGRNARDAASSTLEVHDSLSNTRYLLYDIGATYRAISIALLAIPTATATVAAAYQRDFAQVLRTTGDITPATMELRNELKQLSTEIPQTFSELSNIASIGGQLNIPVEDMAAFSEVVAKFVATTNVSLDEATIAFGRLRDSFKGDSENNPEFFNQIGSAVSELGTRSVATESEIIAIINQLAPLGSLAGFTSYEVAGLSAALASVRIRPELARGSFQRIFFDMSAAADEGGEKLNTFARYAGVTADEAKNLIQNDPSVFFEKFIVGMKGAMDSGQSFNSVLEEVGMKGVRDRQFLLALANGADQLTASMDLAGKSYAEAGFLDKSSEPVFGTLVANLKMMVNAFTNLADTLGAGALTPLTIVVKLMTQVVSTIDSWANASPMVKSILEGLLAFTAVIGVMAAVKSALGFALAAVVGFQQVAGKAAIGTSLSFKGLAGQIAVTMRMARGETAATAAAAVRDLGIMGAAAQASSIQMANAASGPAKMGFSVKSMGSLMMTAVGGPIGALVLSLGVLAGAFFTAQAQAKAAGDAIATAMSAGQAEGAKAIGDALTKKTVGFLDANAFFSSNGKNIRQIADSISLDFDKIVDATMRGDDALKVLDGTLEKVAKEQGFASLEEVLNGTNVSTGGLHGKFEFIRGAVKDLASESATSAEDLKAVEGAAQNLAGSAAWEAIGAGAEETGDALEKMNEELENILGSIFGLVNVESAAAAALQKLGESLYESGSFSTQDEGGRANLANFQEAAQKQAEVYALMITNGEITSQQAATNFAAYIDSLISEIELMGGDTSQLVGMAEVLKSNVAVVLQDPVNMQVGVQTVGVPEAEAELDAIYANYNTIDSTVLVSEHGAQDVATRVGQLQGIIETATGAPYVATVDADTTAANENAANTESFLLTVFGIPVYTATVDADTSYASQAIQAFGQWANDMFTHLGNAMIHLGNGINRLMGGAGDVALMAMPSVAAAPAPSRVAVDGGPVKQSQRPEQKRAEPKIREPKLDSGGGKGPNLSPMKDGYDKAAKAADKAGKAGKKAGKDMEDAAKSAAEAVNDYADRLGSALDDAYRKQHGVSEATDAYYTKLNQIKEKREQEIKTVKDLTASIKALTAERRGDLIEAEKNEMYAKIARQYGDTGRAKEYENEADQARNAAAEKLSKIEVDKKERTEVQNGIGNLKGYSQAAIDNRNDLRDLESKMLDMVEAYARTGKSTNSVRIYTEQLTRRFKDHVTQSGYNIRAFDNTRGAADRYIRVIKSVPRTVSTKAHADTSQANRNINGLQGNINATPRSRGTGFSASTSGARGAIGRLHGDINRVPGHKTITFTLKERNQLSKTKPLYANRPMGFMGPMFGGYDGGVVPRYRSGGLVGGTPPSDPKKDNVLAHIAGSGPALIRSGEFVQPEPAVDYYGTDFMEAIRRMKLPRYNTGGSVGGRGSSGFGNSSGPVVVELTADNIAAILRAGERDINLFADVEKIASTALEGQHILASKGVQI